MSKSGIVYAAIALGMVAALVAWLVLESALVAALIALACYAGCEIYGAFVSPAYFWRGVSAAVRDRLKNGGSGAKSD